MPSKLMNKKHKKRFVGDSQWVESVSTRKLKKNKKKKIQFLTNFIYRKHWTICGLSIKEIIFLYLHYASWDLGVISVMKFMTGKEGIPIINFFSG